MAQNLEDLLILTEKRLGKIKSSVTSQKYTPLDVRLSPGALSPYLTKLKKRVQDLVVKQDSSFELQDSSKPYMTSPNDSRLLNIEISPISSALNIDEVAAIYIDSARGNDTSYQYFGQVLVQNKVLSLKFDDLIFTYMVLQNHKVPDNLTDSLINLVASSIKVEAKTFEQVMASYVLGRRYGDDTLIDFGRIQFNNPGYLRHETTSSSKILNYNTICSRLEAVKEIFTQYNDRLGLESVEREYKSLELPGVRETLDRNSR